MPEDRDAGTLKVAGSCASRDLPAAFGAAPAAAGTHRAQRAAGQVTLFYLYRVLTSQWQEEWESLHLQSRASMMSVCCYQTHRHRHQGSGKLIRVFSLSLLEQQGERQSLLQ